jgi:hypothetical protein
MIAANKHCLNLGQMFIYFPHLLIGQIALIVTLLVTTPLVADDKEVQIEVQSLLQDFRADIARAKAPSNKVLQTEGSKIITQLIRENENDTAKSVGEQVEQKLNGKHISNVDSRLANLFRLYDKASDSATKQIRERYLLRVDSALREYEGKNIPAILVLADIKNEILGRSPINEPQATSPTESFVGHYSFSVGSISMGRELLPNGTVKVEDGSIYGKWVVDGDKLRIDYFNAAWVLFDLLLKKGKMKGKTNRNEDMIAEKETVK